MIYHILFIVSLVAGTTAQASSSAATTTTTSLTPLSSRKVDPNNIPFQVVGDDAGPRGPQAGYNRCNSSTEGPDSMCQTMYINDLTDFCMWSSPKANDVVANSESFEVAWCTKPGHGTRIIPPGTITGAQWLYAKNYIQVVGYLNQANLNLDPTDFGGELDPHGDDEQGNPLGGIAFTNGFGDNAAGFATRLKNNQTNTAPLTQVVEWVDFIGSNLFCLKFCNNNDPNRAQLCNHIYDEIGCTYNAVADYSKINGTFEVCDSDDMTPPGVFTTAPGQTTTWFQPFTPNPTPPYTPNPISSSNCQTFASTELFLAAPTSASAGSSGTAQASNSGPQGTSSGAGPATTGGTNGSNGAISFGAPLAVIGASLFGAVITIAA